MESQGTQRGRWREIGRMLWRADAPLTATALLMIPVLAAAAVGLLADDRLVTGAQAWLKPAKFAASIAIYTLTLAWILAYLPEWRRVRAFAGRTTAATLLLEMAIIVVQAWRGTSSHFNISTPLDSVLWSTMGTAIAVQTAASVVVAVAVWRQRFTDRAMGWALRLGLTIAIAGASSGGLMTRPTQDQWTEARASGRMRIAGAHSVGGHDGGRGLPGTRWSMEHGDLRVPHFLGLHALQALPLMALAIRRRASAAIRERLVIVASASYALLFAILLWQALRGQSLASPDGETVGALVLWIAGTVVAALAAARWRPVQIPAAC